jgi:hypothetical protein
MTLIPFGEDNLPIQKQIISPQINPRDKLKDNKFLSISTNYARTKHVILELLLDKTREPRAGPIHLLLYIGGL